MRNALEINIIEKPFVTLCIKNSVIVRFLNNIFYNLIL